MRIDAISIFPQMFAAVTDSGITSRALAGGQWSFKCWNPRDFVSDNYRRIDDRPYGGGPGMVMMAKPLLAATEAARAEQIETAGGSGPVLLMSAQGRPLTHTGVAALAANDALTIIAGRYEAVDQRFIDRHVDEQINIGDFVVSGGELPAMVLIDAMVRLLPGVLDAEATEQESFVGGLLDCPHYTRPEQLQGDEVPRVLLGGNHQQIAQWRRRQSLLLTRRQRPDLIAAARLAGQLSPDDEQWLAENPD